MKVHQLIEKLAKMEQEAEVVIALEEGDEPLHSACSDDFGSETDPQPVVVLYSGWDDEELEETRQAWRDQWDH